MRSTTSPSERPRREPIRPSDTYARSSTSSAPGGLRPAGPGLRLGGGNFRSVREVALRASRTALPHKAVGLDARRRRGPDGGIHAITRSREAFRGWEEGVTAWAKGDDVLSQLMESLPEGVVVADPRLTE